ncbi:exocyst complex component Sec3-domain-containing protein [Thamnocephalis sphaerospora]|uniref:Exocyst complex component Sec3-domain-containing protein n=1 Tax=Thamnocephalis sphaerospora TaxID=78915 RepID=A0A4P9XNG1_9FUNG|nr:exocyst complex component Sec3-domain-containing protein [Thamnocephalis sphaerospora]|eukprot:RKP07488.1 exocyst complex component Sec3-domain-containing protein [Thamnocephalis sphaerospora]
MERSPLTEEAPAFSELTILESYAEAYSKDFSEAQAIDARLVTDLAQSEAENVRAIMEANDQVEAIITQLESAIRELDSIEAWSETFKGQLKVIGDDVQLIQSQNKAMHVQTRNQKALMHEVDELLAALSIPETSLSMLREESLSTDQGIVKAEEAAARLLRRLNNTFDDGTRDMYVVNERVEYFQLHANNFAVRLVDFLKISFTFQADTCISEYNKSGAVASFALNGHRSLEESLSRYRGLMLWMKEIDPRRHNELLDLYAQAVNVAYKQETKELLDFVVGVLMPKKQQHEDTEHLFTSTTKGGYLPPTPTSGGPMRKYDLAGALAKAVQNIISAVVREQNFVTDLFHLGTSYGYMGWIRNGHKTVGKLDRPREQTKDVKLKKRMMGIMDDLFKGLLVDLMASVEQVARVSSIVSIALLATVEDLLQQLDNSNQQYAILMLTNLQKRLANLYDRFIEEQLRAIEETKVTAKKRTGVLPFIRVFPNFVRRMENALEGCNTAVRKATDDAYAKLVQKMFEASEAIARESEVHADDKEQLNKHILTVENMHHFHLEVRACKVPSLDPFIKMSKASYDLHLTTYIKMNARRAIGKMLEFFDGVDVLLKTTAPQEIGFHVSYNKAQLKKVIGQYPWKEVKRSIEALYKKVNKHFSDEDGLLQVVWHGIQEEFIRDHGRFTDLLQRCYSDTGLTLEFSINDLLDTFSELAKNSRRR